MRGRKPKPTRLKILHGSTEINESEPRAPEGFPSQPDKILSAEAKREWERLSTFATWITEADRGLLTVYCVAWGRLMRALAETHKGGIMKRGAKKGGEYQNQWEAIVKRAGLEVAKFGAMLGLDPSSRSRISVDQSRTDEFEKFLNESAAS